MSDIERLRSRVVAVGSGKGGVGKSTTAVNLAIVAAKSKLNVALVDLDPLSNMATILDVPNERIEKVADRVGNASGTLAAWTVPLFPRIDLLFPRPKLEAGESSRLRASLFERSAAALLDTYDLVLCDMPAGVGHEEHLAFLPYVGLLLVVTNPEPTSHVSAGGYIRVALEIREDLRILFWHNRYRDVMPGGFRPGDVIANYNRYVDDDLRIDDAAKRNIGTIARVPDDPSLNLLQQSLSAEVQVLGKLLDTTQMLHRVIIAALPAPAVEDRELREQLRYFLSFSRVAASEGKGLRASLLELKEHAKQYLSVDPNTEGIPEFLAAYIGHPLAAPIQVALIRLEDAIETMTGRDQLFAQSGTERWSLQQARRSVMRLLDAVNTSGRGMFTTNLGGMVACYLALLMILDSDRIRELISIIMPTRTERDGRRIRDRRMLIRNLVVRNQEYHRRYFRLVKTLYPVLLKQVDRLVVKSGWNRLLLKGPDRKTNRNAYLKLLTQTLHDVLHAGLGVYVGFRYNTAGRAIEEGANRLLAIVTDSAGEAVGPPQRDRSQTHPDRAGAGGG